MILRPYSRSCRTASIRSGIAGGLAGELFFLQLFAGALISSARVALDQAILEAESIQVLDGLMRSAQGLVLGLLEKRGPLPVYFLNALDS